MIHFVLLVSRHGAKVRLSKFYTQYSARERARIVQLLAPMVIARSSKLCNFLDFRGVRVAYKRYAGLYFIVGIDDGDNELHTLDIIHHYVVVLDKHFGNVCELDLIFNFDKAYYMLDEVLVAGRLVESSKNIITTNIEEQDAEMAESAV